MKDSHLPKLEEIAFRFSHTLEKETLDLKDGNERSGVSETVAMRISGHKTRSVFDRYNITSDADFRETARKLQGHNLGTMPARSPSNPSVSALNLSLVPVAQFDRASVS